MNILLLCEGNAESPRAFSGVTLSILRELRSSGDIVSCGDCDLRHFDRYLAAGLTFSPKRARWVARYHLGQTSFALRTRAARNRRVEFGLRADVVLQFGATFTAPTPNGVPYFLYCDSNIRIAEQGRHTGHSWAAALTKAEIDAIARREAEVYRGARAIFTISEHLRQSFINDFAIPPGRVHAVLAGPNFDASHIHVRTTMPSGPPTILFVGAHFERKGGDLLLRAFERVRESIPAARLIMVGSRDASIRGPGVENLGFLHKDDAAEYATLLKAYQQATVFCLPTRFEPFGIAYIEAMLHGLPCVGPNAWAVPEMILDNKTGFLTTPEDVDEVSARLQQLLLDPGLAERLGQAGRAYASETFRWERSVGKMREVMSKSVT